ncbi:MAG: hypothetical protein NVSMB42_11480 [Herpetosiphon sp.]
MAATTEHLLLVVMPGTLRTVEVAALAAPLETTLAYIEQRTAMPLHGRVTVLFTRHADGCSLDGAADTQHRRVMLYACPNVLPARAINILAHELVHQLAHDYYGPMHLEADPALREGLATWGAGSYWLGTDGTFRRFVQRNYQTALLPLALDAEGQDTAGRNKLYYEWASFVEWQLSTFGRSAFDRAYTGGRVANGQAPYATVYGSDEPELERQWRQWLDE